MMDINSIQQNKWLRRALWVCSSVVALWGLAWLLVPPITKSLVESLGSEQLGRRVTLGSLDFKPWTLELTMNDLAVARAQGAANASPQLSIKRIYIDAELQSLLRLAPMLKALDVQAPHVSLTRLDTDHYDADDLLARLRQGPDKPAGASLGFVVYNLSLSGGSIDFTDQPVGKTHLIRDVQIKLPFLSNLDADRKTPVQPQLAFRLNGSQFDVSAQASPLVQTQPIQALFKFSGLDLTQYLGYVPASLPMELTDGVLSADLKLTFEQSPKLAVKLSGTLQADKVRVVSASATTASAKEARLADPQWLTFDQLQLTLADVRPLERVAHLAAVQWRGAHLSVWRDKFGQRSPAILFKPQVATENVAANVYKERARVQKHTENEDWKLSIDKLQLNDASIHWRDEGTSPVARLGLSDVTLQATGIALPLVQPVQFAGSAQLRQEKPFKTETMQNLQQAKHVAQIIFKGSATNQVAAVNVTLADVPLTAAEPYLAQLIVPTVRAQLDADIGLTWAASANPFNPAALQVQARYLTLRDLALLQDQTILARIEKLQLEQAQMDLGLQTVVLGKLAVAGPSVTLGREADGRWMFERWLKTAAMPTLPAAANGNQATTPDKPWSMAIQDMALDGGTVAFLDKTTARPVAFNLEGLSLGVKNFSTSNKKPFDVTLATHMRARKNDTARLAWHGTASLSPLGLQGQLEALRLPMHVFEPYLANALNVKLRKAEASFKGQLSYAQTAQGPKFKLRGDSAIEEFQANSVPQAQAENVPTAGTVLPGLYQASEELLSWKLLSLRGLDLAIAPGAATQVAVQETVLSDFFARLILDASGRLNLQDLLTSPALGTPATPLEPASKPKPGLAVAPELIASYAVSDRSKGQNNAEEGLKPVVRFGPVTLVGGRVHFSDRFIKPNYSAHLTELTGKLSAFSSESQPGEAALAELELRGRAEGTASLEILGKVNPLSTPVVLDIAGHVRDLELAPLSPYSVRYAGYGIERGKLSVDVGYVVQPDGQLTASHNIVLNQLSFGDKVDGAPASLPVKLAVALLADRNGVIDINLPVNGSLNDPQFRLAPIVFKLIGNLILKAVTSPFSLLASAFSSGSGDLSVIDFAPGTAVLGQDAKSGLDKIVKALVERPALKMTVVGTASLAVEREAYQRAQLEALVQAEKRRATVVNGARVAAQREGQGAESGGADTVVTANDYPVLLKSVYRRADFPKPRNLLGLSKNLSVNEMEALLLAHLPATDETMRELAVQRGVSVRDYLAAQKLPLERLFLGAAKTAAPEAKWHPHAELNLSLD